MLYLRGQARDYDEWAQLTGDSGWAWQNVLPIFMKVEDHWRGADEKRLERGVLSRNSEPSPTATESTRSMVRLTDRTGVGSGVGMFMGVR